MVPLSQGIHNRACLRVAQFQVFRLILLLSSNLLLVRNDKAEVVEMLFIQGRHNTWNVIVEPRSRSHGLL